MPSARMCCSSPDSQACDHGLLPELINQMEPLLPKAAGLSCFVPEQEIWPIHSYRFEPIMSIHLIFNWLSSHLLQVMSTRNQLSKKKFWSGNDFVSPSFSSSTVLNWGLSFFQNSESKPTSFQLPWIFIRSQLSTLGCVIAHFSLGAFFLALTSDGVVNLHAIALNFSYEVFTADLRYADQCFPAHLEPFWLLLSLNILSSLFSFLSSPRDPIIWLLEPQKSLRLHPFLFILSFFSVAQIG